MMVVVAVGGDVQRSALLNAGSTTQTRPLSDADFLNGNVVPLLDNDAFLPQKDRDSPAFQPETHLRHEDEGVDSLATPRPVGNLNLSSSLATDNGHCVCYDVAEGKSSSSRDPPGFEGVRTASGPVELMPSVHPQTPSGPVERMPFVHPQTPSGPVERMPSVHPQTPLGPVEPVPFVHPQTPLGPVEPVPFVHPQTPLGPVEPVPFVHPQTPSGPVERMPFVHPQTPSGPLPGETDERRLSPHGGQPVTPGLRPQRPFTGQAFSSTPVAGLQHVHRHHRPSIAFSPVISAEHTDAPSSLDGKASRCGRLLGVKDERDSRRLVEIESPSTETTSQGSTAREDEEILSWPCLFLRCRVEEDSGFACVTSRPGCGIVESVMSAKRGRLLCAERVSQMTKTYNDIEAVTRLLEEKERDLELAARIGQTLLSKNKDLATRTEVLEEQLSVTNDKVSQLRHDLTTKEELLRFFNEDLENNDSGAASQSEDDGKEKSFVNLDVLQKKVQALEEENVVLRSECTDLKTATESYEDKEKKLVEDCVKQLAEVNSQVETFSQELQHRAEENTQQKEEVAILMSQISERQKKINQMTIDNLDLHDKLTLSTESQRKLTKELGGMQDKYDEMFEKLEEMQDELCLLRGKQKIRAGGRHHHAAYSFPTDSLASELETSLQQELSQSSQRAQSWKVFETAKAAKRAIAKASSRHSAASSSLRTSGSLTSAWDSDTASNISANASSDMDSMNSDGYSADMDSLYESNSELGRPGIPGSCDLETALRSLALNPSGEVVTNASVALEESGGRKKVNRSDLSRSPANTSGRASPSSASISTSMTGGGSVSVASSQGFKMDKLQIVKPMQGSMTLRHWQQLATPHLGGIFEQRDGVQMKGEGKLELREERYSLSDLEEDDDPNEARSLGMGSEFLQFVQDSEKYSGSNDGLGALLDPRMPSPSLQSFRSSSSGSAKSIQTSTPKSTVENCETSQLPPRGGLGLAELLSGHDNPTVGRALMRVSSWNASKKRPAGGSTSSNASNEGTLVNRSSFLSRSANSLPQTEPSSSPSTSTCSPVHLSAAFKDLPGSRSLDAVSPDYPPVEETQHLGIASSSSPSQNAAQGEDSKHFSPGMTGQGFLQQLKNRGFSLYGLWSGTAGGSSPSPSSSSPSLSAPSWPSMDTKGAIPATSFGRAHARMATGLSVDSPPTMADDEDATAVSADNILPPGSGTGVLGAITNFRRGGIL